VKFLDLVLGAYEVVIEFFGFLLAPGKALFHGVEKVGEALTIIAFLLGELADLLADRFHPLFEVRNFAHEATSFGAACPAFVAPMP
jgi:hypothetical protein